MKETKGVAPTAIVAVIIVAIIAAVGVWYATRAPPEKATIKVATVDSTLPAMEAIKSAFEDEYPDIDVELVSMPWPDLYPKQSLSLKKDVGTYDIVYMDWSWVVEWADAGWLEPVEDIAPVEYEEEASDYYWDHFGYNDHLWSMGVQGVAAMVLAYNEDMLTQAGIDHPPETVSELVDQCLTIKDQGIAEYPLTLGLMATEGLSQEMNIIVRAYGGETWNPDGTPSFNTGAGRNAVKFLQDAVQVHCIVDPGNVELLDHEAWMKLCTKDAAFGIIWSFYVAPTNDPEVSEAAGNIKVRTFPATAAGEPAAFPSGMGCALAANSAHKDAAEEFMAFSATRESARKYFYTSGFFVPYSDLYEEKADEWPWVAMYSEIEKNFQLQAKSPWYAEASDIWAEEVQNAATGKSVEEALNDAEDRINAVIAGY